MTAGHEDNSTELCSIDYEGRALQGRRDERLLDVLLTWGIDHRHICGGNGFCTSCRVEVLEGDGLSPLSPLERERLGSSAGRLRLACQCRLRGYVRLRVPVPQSSRFSPYGE